MGRARRCVGGEMRFTRWRDRESEIADCTESREDFERINTSSSALQWEHACMGGGDSGWNQLECRPNHKMQPVLLITRGRCSDAEVSITCKNEGGDEVVIANVIVPFRDGIAACSICDGDGGVTLDGDTKEECPWCLGVESTSMDEAKEIASALYWSWIKTTGQGKLIKMNKSKTHA